MSSEDIWARGTCIDASWVERVADTLLERLAARPALRMCLATGSTPLPVYERVASAPGAFAAASVLLLDEFGGLPPDEPERWDAVLRHVLVDHVALAELPHDRRRTRRTSTLSVRRSTNGLIVVVSISPCSGSASTGSSA